MATNLRGQELKNPFYQDTITVMTDKCREEIIQADSDFEKNTFVIELEKPIPFTDTQQKVLLERYGIQTVFQTGLFSPNNDCYNFHLKTLVKSKWKRDIFKTSKSIADSLDKIGLGDQQAQLRTSDDEFYAFIKKNLSSRTKNKLKRGNLKTIYLEVEISETGDADNVKILDFISYGDVEIEILTLIKGKQLWIPKTDNGKGTKTWIVYPVKIADL
jgi:hypothetical protein